MIELNEENIFHFTKFIFIYFTREEKRCEQRRKEKKYKSFLTLQGKKKKKKLKKRG
jgi:hypothetical protein